MTTQNATPTTPPARVRTLELAVLAAVAFVPVLAVAPGVVTSDTKTYLYLDPARFLGQVASMWYPTVALGTVTHQYVGYLFPMGPYYALAAAVHLPTWIAQRLWLGAILFAAGAGIVALARRFGLSGGGPLVAAFAYMLSPYVLQYAGRISVILLPWAGLPWLVLFTVRAVERGGWRDPAAFALVVAVVSGINASSMLYVAVGPVLWLVYAAALTREATWRHTLGVVAKLALLSAAVSAWWVLGLVVEAGYGVDVLRYTESVPATSSTSSTLEVLRGLGYWYFYGSGRLGPWTRSSILYTRWLWLVAVSYAVPVGAFAAAAAVRWRQRGFLVLLIVVGTVLSVGAYPYAHPTAAGGLLRAFMSDTTAGLAMRSTDRATPLVLLGIALLLGAGVAALRARHVAAGWLAGAAAVGLVAADDPGAVTGNLQVVAGLTQPAQLPAYERAALAALDRVHHSTRVLGIPGNDFAAYTWGDTTDTPQPALLTRPFVTREQQVMGSMATADTLYAMDAPIQTATGGLGALGPMARLLSAGDVLVEYDQKSAAYGVVPASVLARWLAATPRGLTGMRTYGSPGRRVARPTLDPEVLAVAPTGGRPTPLATYVVAHPRPVTRGESDTGALVVAGDATGLESLAAQGLLTTTAPVYYAGTLDTRPSLRQTVLARHPTLVVTDSNRKQGFRWNSLTANTGAVETAGAALTASTPSDSPIDLFPGAPTGSQTVATYVGATSVTASSYGNSVTYTPEQRPYAAIDGNPRTAWETGTYVSDVTGQWWQATWGHPVAASAVTLVQPQGGTRRRHITEVTLTFTGRHPVTVRLGRASRRRGGQTVTFGRRSWRRLRITIDATSNQHGTPVGLAEVEVPGQRVVEIDQLPTDLLRAAGRASESDRLVIAMTRARVSPYSVRSDPQTTLDRSFTLPTARTFSLTGTATIARGLADDQVARLVGAAGETGAGVVAYSSGRLTGDLAAGAWAPADGTSQAPWQPPFGAANQTGSWLEYNVPAPVTFDHLTVGVLADRRHSVPTAVRLSVETPARHSTVSRSLTLPPITRRQRAGTTVTATLRFPPVTGRRIRVTFTGVHDKRAKLAGGTYSTVLPIGVARLSIPGVRAAAPPAALPGTCHSDLVAIDGHPVTVRVVGSTAAALGEDQVALQGCGADRGGIRLGPGHHVVTTSLATTPAGIGLVCAAGPGCAGWNVDALTLSSAPGGGAATPSAAAGASAAGGAAGGAAGTAAGGGVGTGVSAAAGASIGATPTAGARALAPPVPGPAPTVTVRAASATSQTVDVTRASAPFELVLGQSIDAGWHAVATPAPGAPPGAHPVTLGTPALVDAFANGWQVSARDLAALGARGAGVAGGRFTVTLTWQPQRTVWLGIAVSASAIAGCLAVVVVGSRRARRRGGRGRGAGPGAAAGANSVGNAGRWPIATAPGPTRAAASAPGPGRAAPSHRCSCGTCPAARVDPGPGRRCAPRRWPAGWRPS